MNKKIIGISILAIGLVASGVIWINGRSGEEGSVAVPLVADGPQTDPRTITAQVKAGKAALIDVRTDAEWSDAHAATAIHFDVVRLENGEMISLPKDSLIYLYCRTGHRAGNAKTILEQNGYTNVINLGGLSDWQAKGGQVVGANV